ncbi:MAG TPA: HEAT repeat domain-containing protein [Cyclobacteriaceae bacterium]|nr:HEAT repeat domain-containing protein [Cyclobacteriaceae bacterium]HRF32083.1 HEAT repeat domain-containing protein [Cyclobacteriaceae bacterium]
MLKRLWSVLDVEPDETGQVSLLLIMSFLMGLFLATVSVASLTLFLAHFDERTDLPQALAISGGIGVLITILYNFLQGRIPFTALAVFNLLLVILLTGFIEFGEPYVQDTNLLFYFGFTLILPFTFVTQLVFWGSFNRMFNVRDSRRLVGSVDVGTDIAAIISFFSIPILLSSGVEPESLYAIGLVSIIGYLALFVILSRKYLASGKRAIKSESEIKKLTLGQFFSNKYILTLSLFITVSLIALRFVDYTFFNATTIQYTEGDQLDNDRLAIFLSLFEATVVIFSFLFTTFVTNRINQDYGLRVSLLINPIILLIFTGAAFALGSYFGYDLTTGEKGTITFFFIAVAMSKLFINSLREALDNPTFKFYYVPIDRSISIDAQTKIEGTVTAFASLLAGGIIVLINSFDIFTVLSITAFTIPILVLWYWITNRMHKGYRETLQSSLVKNKLTVKKNLVKEYTLDSVLEKEVRSTAEDKIIYGLKLMEKLEPALFETSLLQLAESSSKKVSQFARKKIEELGILTAENEIKGLATQAAGMAEDSDLLSIPVEKLMKLSKSVKQTDRLLAAKLMRKLTNQKTIFILLELMRDADPKVRTEALLTARKVKRPETWNVLVELLASPRYAHQAASALKEAGPPALAVLETAFHKSGQNDLVMLKLIQIIGHIPGQESLQLLWKKIDYPDKRIVKQILYSLRYINYRASGREALAVKELLDAEMSKTLWNLAALHELPDEPIYKYLREALREEVRDNFDHLSLLLSLLYDPESVQLVKENLELGTPDSVQYALELLDLFVDQDLKPTLIPLLDDSPTPKKLEQLQTYFPRESYTPIQVINYILNRDFNYNNRWTKVCAVHACAYIPNFRVSRGLISQMFNSDKLLQETTAWVIYNKDKTAYQSISERLPYKDKKFLDSSIENNQLLDGLDDGFFLYIEMIMLIKSIPVFYHILGKVLSDLADKIQPITLKANEKFNIPQSEEMPILILAHGNAQLINDGQLVMNMNPGDVYGDLFQEGPTPVINQVQALERTVLFKISLVDFYFVLANHHELAQGLIHNITEQPEKQPAT